MHAMYSSGLDPYDEKPIKYLFGMKRSFWNSESMAFMEKLIS